MYLFWYEQKEKLCSMGIQQEFFYFIHLKRNSYSSLAILIRKHHLVVEAVI